MVITIVIGAFGTVTKELVQGPEDLELGGQEETIQTTALLRSDGKLRRAQDTGGDIMSLKLQWKTIG